VRDGRHGRRGPRGGGSHIQTVGLPVVPSPVHGEFGTAEELRENEAVQQQQQQQQQPKQQQQR